MSYIGLRPQRQTLSTSTEKFSGNGVDLEFTLSRSVSKSADIRVFVGTASKVPEVDYTAQGTQLLFTAGNAPTAGTDNVIVTYLAGALATVYLSANSFPSGTTTDPAIRFVDAVTTGMWLPTTSTLGFAVSGNTRLTVSDSPTATNTSTGALRVVGGIGATGALYLGDSLRVQGNTAATNSLTGALTVAGGVGVSGDIFVAGQLQVAGDFTVAGTFTTTGSDNLILNDPFLFLANANPGDSLDTGFVASYNDGTQRYTGLFRDITDGQYKLFKNLTVSPTTTVDTASASFQLANLVVGNIQATNIIGNISGGAPATTVGNLVSLEVTGATSLIGTLFANSGVAATSVNTGAIRVPAGGGIGVTGNVHAGVQIVAPTFIGNLQATSISGTLSTAAQTNITSVGTLSALTASGNVTSSSGWGVFENARITGPGGVISWQQTGGNLIGKDEQFIRFGTQVIELYSSSNANIELNTGTGFTVVGNIIPSANNVSNIGRVGAVFNTIFAKSTSAQYADVAERYLADQFYEPGTVLHFGGIAEVSRCDTEHCTRVAGVVSTAPAYTMNDGLQGPNVVMLALLGRVPCKVTGSISKGDMLVSAGNGRARAESNPRIGTVIGKALENFNGLDGVIEVVVGKV